MIMGEVWIFIGSILWICVYNEVDLCYPLIGFSNGEYHILRQRDYDHAACIDDRTDIISISSARIHPNGC